MIVAWLSLLLAGNAAAAVFDSPIECLIVTLSNVPVNDSSTCDGDNNPVVTVAQGSLRGRKVTSRRTGGEHYSFQGIPYAQPPVGDLRFKAPQAPSSWTGVRDATSEGNICPQYDNGPIRGSEDCLFLNVYTPRLPRSKNRSLLPVMVWIHGGGSFGSGNSAVYSPDFLVDKNVVYVSMNYRVGVLGFLGVRSTLVSQNNGLKDQLAALQWIQANIARFGGDKNKVTIFGQSYGADCVELHMLSPATAGLFHGAILQSGNAIDRWAYVEPSRASERAFILGQLLGSNTTNADELANVLKSASVVDLLNNQENAYTAEDRLRSADIPFLPTREEPGAGNTYVFLPDTPVNILKSGVYQHVPYITGFTSDEAKFAYLPYAMDPSLWGTISGNMEQFVPPERQIPLNSSLSVSLAAQILSLYFRNVTPTIATIQDLTTLGTDAFFIQGVRRSAQHHVNTSSTPVYAYQFSYVGKPSISEYCNFNYSYRGAAHSDELGYLFWIKRIETNETRRDILIRDRMTTMWTNFARTGNPNGHHQHFTWNPFTITRQKYLNIDEDFSMRNFRNLRPNQFAFWDRVYEPIDN